MERDYTTFDIIRALNIPRERLRHWLEEGLVHPSIQKAKGVGDKALFSYQDVVAIALMANLIDIGFSKLHACIMAGSAMLSDFGDSELIMSRVGIIRNARSKRGRRVIVTPSMERAVKSDSVFDKEGAPDFCVYINIRKLRKDVKDALERLD
jgi:hypothetical protein